MLASIFLIVFVLALGVVCGFYALRREYAISLFNLLWLGIFVICCREFIMEQYALTLVILCMMVIMINLGYYLWNKKCKLQYEKKYKTCLIYEVDKKILMTILVLSCLIFAWYAIKTLWIFGLDLRTIRASNNVNNVGSAFGGIVDTVLFYGVATPLLYTVILSFAYEFSQNRKVEIKFYFLALITILLQMITTGGGRSVILRMILFFGAAVLVRIAAGDFLDKKKIVGLLLTGAFLVVLLEAVTFIRNEGEITFIGQAMEYIRGAIAHMQYRLTRIEGFQFYGGYVTFGGFLYYPVKVLNVLTGLDIPTSNDMMAYLQEYRRVYLYNQSMNYNALVPNAFYFFYDCGFVGVIVFSAIHGVLMAISERKVKALSFLGFVMWATCIYMIAYSPLDGVLWTFRHPTTIICCVVLNSFLYKKKKYTKGKKYEAID